MRPRGDGHVVVAATHAFRCRPRRWSPLLALVSPNEQKLGVFGSAVSGAGDTNQDGLDDVIVGAPGESPGTRKQDTGRA